MSRLSFPTEPFSDTSPVSRTSQEAIEMEKQENVCKKCSPSKFVSIFNLWRVVSEKAGGREARSKK